MTDNVNRPVHYIQFRIEVIEVTRHLSFNIGNAVKYCCRAKFKNNFEEDLKKALWYLNDEIHNNKSNPFLKSINPEVETVFLILIEDLLSISVNLALVVKNCFDFHISNNLDYLNDSVSKLNRLLAN